MTAPQREFELVAGPLRMRVGPDGKVRVGWNEPDWLGPGVLSVTETQSAPAVRDSDGEVAVERGAVRASMRTLDGESAIVVRLESLAAQCIASPDGFASPPVAWHFDPAARESAGAPTGMRAFGYQFTEFALPVFSDEQLERWRLLPWRPAIVFPLALLAPDGRTVLLAPLDRFHDQVIAVPANRDDPRRGLSAGWHGDLGDVARGFATQLAIIAGHGLRDSLATWSRLLRADSNVPPPPRDADRLATHVSYWTDNGSAYWYHSAPGLDMASSIVAAVDDLEDRGVPVGSVQLDSWWYPHAVSRSLNVDDEIVPPTGMRVWEPRADALPDGIPALRERLRGRHLVAHCRHLSSESMYADAFPMWIDGDRAHPSNDELYDRLLDQAVAWGIDVFEH
ncbi:MAG TPA: hypothetical protein VFR41_05030, partial [Acidimicrobiia bacterium]|nr:hypothetical protein [Acidimicrobiia bacterium]